MKAEFDNANIKIWFNTLSTSRNFYNVREIIQEGNAARLKHFLNFENVNMIEEIETENMNKKMQELKAKFKKV